MNIHQIIPDWPEWAVGDSRGHARGRNIIENADRIFALGQGCPSCVCSHRSQRDCGVREIIKNCLSPLSNVDHNHDASTILSIEHTVPSTRVEGSSSVLGRPEDSHENPTWAKGGGASRYVARDMIQNPDKVYPLGQGCNACNEMRRICYTQDQFSKCASCMTLESDHDCIFPLVIAVSSKSFPRRPERVSTRLRKRTEKYRGSEMYTVSEKHAESDTRVDFVPPRVSVEKPSTLARVRPEGAAFGFSTQDEHLPTAFVPVEKQRQLIAPPESSSRGKDREQAWKDVEKPPPAADSSTRPLLYSGKSRSRSPLYIRYVNSRPRSVSRSTQGMGAVSRSSRQTTPIPRAQSVASRTPNNCEMSDVPGGIHVHKGGTVTVHQYHFHGTHDSHQIMSRVQQQGGPQEWADSARDLMDNCEEMEGYGIMHTVVKKLASAVLEVRNAVHK